jgi:hypothetical protein
MDSGVEFVAVDNPHANKLTIPYPGGCRPTPARDHQLAESAALKAAKARGKRLGNPKLSEARRHAAAAKKERADRYSANVLPVIREIPGAELSRFAVLHELWPREALSTVARGESLGNRAIGIGQPLY